jgi:TonB family protein
MKKQSILLAVALGLCAPALTPLLLAQATPESATGSWSVTEFDTKGKEKLRYHLVLGQNGEGLNGWVYYSRGQPWTSGTVAGTIHGDVVGLALNYWHQQNEHLQAKFEGRRSGDRIAGTIVYSKKGRGKEEERQFTAVQTDPGAVWVSPDVANTHLRKQVKPVYPPLAHMGHIQGDVRLMVTISEGGNVSDVTVVYGHPMLVRSAMEAGEKFLYEPFLLQGKAVAVKTIVTCTFKY